MIRFLESVTAESQQTSLAFNHIPLLVQYAVPFSLYVIAVISVSLTTHLA
jgi:hypothetical protein